MASNIIQVITIIENLASENILLVDANLYILPHIDSNLKGKGEEYIYELVKTLNSKVKNSLVVFFVQGNAINKGSTLINKLKELLNIYGIDLEKLNYLWYDLALTEPFSTLKTKIILEYQSWSFQQQTMFNFEAKQFVDHAIEHIHRYLSSHGHNTLVVSEDKDVSLSRKRIGFQSYESVSNIIISNIRIVDMDDRSFNLKGVESPGGSSNQSPRNFGEHKSENKDVAKVFEDLDIEEGSEHLVSELGQTRSLSLGSEAGSSGSMLGSEAGPSGSMLGSEAGPSGSLAVAGTRVIRGGRGGRERGGRGRGGRGRGIIDPSYIQQKFNKILSDLKTASSINEIEEALENASVYKDKEEIKVEITDKVTLLSDINKVISDLKKARQKEEISEALEKAYEYENIKEVKFEINNVKALMSILDLLPSYEPEQPNPDAPYYGSTENLVSKLLQFLNS
jgi:hypothetical protein